ncbi:hypothetical protein WH50_13995 [Pokkaliibacter plantistimulans]|uniref:SseB protein N-terminal domain-containing protein n=1 Tax=Pokkaliibacter plantistimulans TaxID=1635171 RepID=A0ABX5LVM5_9GAMM|nr:hypothetical protein [Pokkaliibacter plantistimulans]PXF30702.1 hypothetical protein WH50_13995 [Pokkaliibacter plantistimulans]
MDIEKINVASTTKLDSDYNELFELLKGKELYFNFIKPEKNNEPLRVPLARVGEKIRAVVFFTKRENKKLEKSHGGIVWEKALEMVAKMDDADGLIIENSERAWIAINKGTIQKIITNTFEI